MDFFSFFKSYLALRPASKAYIMNIAMVIPVWLFNMSEFSFSFFKSHDVYFNIIASYCIAMAWTIMVNNFFSSLKSQNNKITENQDYLGVTVASGMYSITYLLIFTSISHFIKPSFTHFVLSVFFIQLIITGVFFIKGVNYIRKNNTHKN